MCDNQNVRDMTRVSSADIKHLITHFAKNTYRAKEDDTENNNILKKSIELMKVDYNVAIINNVNGELSSQYPGQLVFLEGENTHNQPSPAGTAQRQTNTIYESMSEVRDLITKARFARCRARFPLPVILYKGKYICRSATLSGTPEIYGRSGIEYFFYGSDSASSEPIDSSEKQLLDRVRGHDIELLKSFNVGTIVDFMVENKKVKFGVNVTSSEKIDKQNRYASFNIICLPYPGCEFFKEFRDHDYIAHGLVFDWSQTHVDATIRVPDNSFTSQLSIQWDQYKDWDLAQITQNYMKLLLKYIQENNTGLLIHCISGWDRTPLFVSLLRLSLWADNLIHQNLDVYQILYLTISYDWMLFGHHLVDRVCKGEEIFFFCFYMLKYLCDDEFSIAQPTRFKNNKLVSRTDSDLHLDGVLLDQDSRGSNVSLNSSSSSVSNKSQEQSAVCNFNDELNNGNPQSSPDMSNPLMLSPQQRRTSPVAVPIATRLRQRQESLSSLSTGSWQMISGTGSLRSSDSTSTIDSNSGNSNRGDGSNSQDSSCTVIDEEASINIRRERLERARKTFYKIYSGICGFKFKMGSDSTLGAFLGNFAEKVGFSQRT